MKYWFTSDIHFCHANIIQYCNRPFSSIDEMNQALIERWNARVGPNDTVYLLGDVAFGPPAKSIPLLRALNGTIHLIAGNHDHKHLRNQLWRSRFASVNDIRNVTLNTPVGKRTIVMCHFPLLEWDGYYRGAWHVHGHCHGSRPPQQGIPRLDVGIDCHNWAPISLEELTEKIRELCPTA